MNQMSDLAESNPDAYARVFAWLTGVATINTELAEQLDKAIDYMKRTYPQ